MVETEVGAWIEQHLERGRNGSVVAPLLRAVRGQTAAGAVARDNESCRVGAQFARVPQRPSGSCQCVVLCAGKRVPRGSAVVHRDHRGGCEIRKATTGSVRGEEIADYKTAAVEPDDKWPRPTVL